MAVNIGAGFNPITQEPIDSRIIAADAATRTNLPWYKCFKGLQVYQLDTSVLYVCTNVPNDSTAPVWSILATPTDSEFGPTFPFSGSAAITGSLHVIGPTVIGNTFIDTAYDLHVSQSLFAPIISASQTQIQGDGTQDLFLVKLNDSNDSKFVINLEGVTVLGAFDATPNAVAGGMFYSGSGHFYLGF